MFNEPYTWALVTEFNLSYHKKTTILFTIDPYYNKNPDTGKGSHDGKDRRDPLAPIEAAGVSNCPSLRRCAWLVERIAHEGHGSSRHKSRNQCSSPVLQLRPVTRGNQKTEEQKKKKNLLCEETTQPMGHAIKTFSTHCCCCASSTTALDIYFWNVGSEIHCFST